MQQINIALDVYSILLCLSMAVYLCLNGRRAVKINRFFILMCIFNLGMLMGDLTNWTCEGFAKPWYPAALRAGSFLFFASSAPLLLAFMGYVIEHLSARVCVHRGIWHAACLLSAVQLLLSGLSLRYGLYFAIGGDNLYRRGNLFWLSQLIPVLIYCLAAVLLFRFRRHLRHKDFLFLMGVIALPLAAELIQNGNYGIALMNTGITFSLFLVFINIQAERELVMQKQENALTEARMDMMMSQIQPHFLYNVLAVIRHLCSTEPMQAKEAVQDLALFLRANMESLAGKELIPFRQEIAHTEYYLKLEKRRFAERLNVVWDIKEWDFRLPPLTLQPIVENAVRHGIMGLENGGTVTIRAEKDDSVCRITVSDDGPGLPPPDKTACKAKTRRVGRTQTENAGGEEHCGIGIENVRKRIQLLCGGTLVLESEAGCGTRAVIAIPIAANVGDKL